VQSLGVGAAGCKVTGNPLDRCEVGRLVIETQFSSYSAHDPYRFSVGGVGCAA